MPHGKPRKHPLTLDMKTLVLSEVRPLRDREIVMPSDYTAFQSAPTLKALRRMQDAGIYDIVPIADAPKASRGVGMMAIEACAEGYSLGYFRRRDTGWCLKGAGTMPSAAKVRLSARPK